MGTTLDHALETGTLIEEDVRAAFLAEVARGTRSFASIAPETSVSYATLMSWKDGKYQGDNTRVTRDINAWLTTRAARQETLITMPAVPVFQATRTAKRIGDLLQEAQMLPSMTMITGGAGVGKTWACRAYQKRMSNVHIATAQPYVTTVKILFDVISDALKIGVLRSTADTAAGIRRKLNGSGALLIIDDVQHLSPHLLDQVRHIHDETEIGIALVGNSAALRQIGADRRVELFAPLYSRLGMKVNFKNPLKEDINTVMDAWGLIAREARDYARAVALKPGGQRSMKMVLLKAFAMAAAAGLVQPAREHIEAVWTQLSGTNEEGS